MKKTYKILIKYKYIYMMDSTTIIFITLSVNLLYQLIHYLIRKITNIYALRNEQEIKNKLKISSDESDKDAITEIHV